MAKAQTDPAANSLWISRSTGDAYDAAQICRRFPNLKRVYVPLFQLSPRLSGEGLAIPSGYLEHEASQYAYFRKSGVQVFGVFTPFRVEGFAGRIDSQWLERPYRFGLPEETVPLYLSIYSSAVKDYCAAVLGECLRVGKVDGVVLNLGYPSTVLFAYGPAAREHLANTYHFDPIDVDYPLGISKEVKMKDQELVDLMVRDRLQQIDDLVGRLAGVASAAGKSTVLFGSIEAYQYPATTRAAMATDWANLLLKDRSLSVILTHSNAESLSSSSLAGLFSLQKKLAINPDRLSILLSKPDDGQALRRFEVEARTSPGSLSRVAYYAAKP